VQPLTKFAQPLAQPFAQPLAKSAPPLAKFAQECHLRFELT
jgi:hypothetical protein